MPEGLPKADDRVDWDHLADDGPDPLVAGTIGGRIDGVLSLRWLGWVVLTTCMGFSGRQGATRSFEQSKAG